MIILDFYPKSKLDFKSCRNSVNLDSLLIIDKATEIESV